jgi:hypothetical protein
MGRNKLGIYFRARLLGTEKTELFDTVHLHATVLNESINDGIFYDVLIE